MRLSALLAAPLAWLLLLSGAPAAAADRPIGGRKLLLREAPSGPAANRLVHVGTGAGIQVGAGGGPGDPRCAGAGGGGASSLRIAASGGAGDVTIPLPCLGWSSNQAGTLYRYKDPSGATCKLVLVKNGALVKAVCKGAHLALDVSAGAAPVTIVATLNQDRFCADYGGTAVRDGGDGVTLLHRDAPAPAACPTTSTTVTATSTTTSTSLACCILYAGQCTWTPSEVACIIAGGVGVGPAGTVCDGVTGGCTGPPAGTGYCCQYPGAICTSGPTGDPTDCVEGGGVVFADATCRPDGVCE
jgi:hypothetical protein